jgi:hypothetical protein
MYFYFVSLLLSCKNYVVYLLKYLNSLTLVLDLSSSSSSYTTSSEKDETRNIEAIFDSLGQIVLQCDSHLENIFSDLSSNYLLIPSKKNNKSKKKSLSVAHHEHSHASTFTSSDLLSLLLKSSFLFSTDSIDILSLSHNAIDSSPSLPPMPSNKDKYFNMFCSYFETSSDLLSLDLIFLKEFEGFLPLLIEHHGLQPFINIYKSLLNDIFDSMSHPSFTSFTELSTIKNKQLHFVSIIFPFLYEAISFSSLKICLVKEEFKNNVKLLFDLFSSLLRNYPKLLSLLGSNKTQKEASRFISVFNELAKFTTRFYKKNLFFFSFFL